MKEAPYVYKAQFFSIRYTNENLKESSTEHSIQLNHFIYCFLLRDLWSKK